MTHGSDPIRRHTPSSASLPALLAGLLTTIVAFGGGATQAQTLDVPCTDGIFSGDVTAYYQQIQADAGTPGSLYSSLSWEKKLMVDECANRAPGPDSERYNLRELAYDGQGNVIGRVYDYLEPADRTICQEAPPTFGGTAPTVACRQGRWYHTAVVLSGCYTDNVFGDSDYMRSVGWTQGNAHYQRLRQSDQSWARASCTGSPGFNMNPFRLDAAGQNSSADGSGALISNADVFTFNENLLAPPTGSRPFGLHAATSTVWNMLFSTWDVGDNNQDGTEERDGQEDTWTSPWVLPPTGGDGPVGSAAPLCEGIAAGSSCDLGYASTWWDSTNLWEWQVVYEFSWDASSCTPLDADAFTLDFLSGTHASPEKNQFDLCGDPDNLGALTLIKDSVPDNPWNDFRFNVTGPSPGFVVLQDPGAAECVDGNEWAACSSATPWNADDRFSWTDLIASNNTLAPGPYRVTESAALGTDITGYSTRYECRNVNPTTCSPAFVATQEDPFAASACAAVQPTNCGTVAGFVGGAVSGFGLASVPFSVCPGAHVICQFTNEGGAEECVESANAIGDLQVFGGVLQDNVAFTTAAVPVQAADAADTIFLSSFVPLADVSRWPGNVDQFILPLPVVENAEGDLVPDLSVTCADEEDTGCLAWRAGDQIVSQAPSPDEVTSSRRIGGGVDQRRVTYTQGGSTAVVPRLIRAFDWSDSDSSSNEHDLWDGFGLSYVAGDTVSESSARTTARSIVNQTLQIREATVADPDAPSGERTFSFVAGDFFHSDPVLVAGPQNFYYLANDLEGNGHACDDSVNPNRGYRCFFEQHRRRRRVLLAGSNDGQIHGFDAGVYQGDVVDQRLVGEFTTGTGKEVFAHIARPMLEHTADMTMLEHEFGVDGSLTVDDFFIDPAHPGVPAAADREWRTVAIAAYREGSRGLFALDLTQPDPIEQEQVLDFSGQPDTELVPDAEGAEPACSSIGGTVPSGCGTLAYPASLWEFQDECTFVVGTSGTSVVLPCDDDGNGQPDLGLAWSQVNTGRILVNVTGQDDPVAKFVAIFGGGIDPDDRTGIGNFLYMVDVETGKAIYKRELSAAAPSEPAAVDTTQDGILDTLYIGTVDGLMHKVDLSQPADLNPTSGRLDDPTQWEPFAIFDTGNRPIFYPPTVLYVANLGHYAIAFGTGDRHDLFSVSDTGQEGRFYTLVDPGFRAGEAPLVSGPLTEASYQLIPAESAGTSLDFLSTPLDSRQPGWVLQLTSDERVVTKALALSGLMVFTTFSPETELVCEYGGNGSVYALLATNANSIAGVDQARATTVEGFAGRPVVMPEGMSQSSESEPGATLDPFEAARDQNIRLNLMDLFPADCRFGNFSLNVGVTLSNTSQLPIASVPVCVARKNWTEQ